MTSKADYTEAEWTRLKRAPFLAGMAISLADPGGPIEAVKETAATLKSVVRAADGDHGELVQAIARDVRDDASRRKSPMAGFKPASGATAGVEILDELREVARLVADKGGGAEEAEQLREWLVAVAQEAADAAKEGGFMGFHAVRVSEGEQRMLDQLRQVLGTHPS
jgi:hypothetical protein